jgi:hypothetical protein
VSVLCEIYNFLRDQAGLLALVAGVVAYVGAIQAAKMQVRAANAQTVAVTQQNTELKNENRRARAREGLIATRLLGGVLGRIQDDIERLQKLLGHRDYLKEGRVADSGWQRLIHKPPLEVVWINLGRCGFEVIQNYLRLDAKLDEFAALADSELAESMRKILAELSIIVNFLRAELDGEAQRCNATLSALIPQP